MYYREFNKLINFILIKKLLKTGKQRNSISIKNNLLLLTYNNNLLQQAILKLLIPINFNVKKIGYIKYHIPVLIHYYKSICLALSWLFKAAKIKSSNNTCFIKALYLECYNVLKQQGTAYNYKQQYIKKALINRVFNYLIILKK